MPPSQLDIIHVSSPRARWTSQKCCKKWVSFGTAITKFDRRLSLVFSRCESCTTGVDRVISVDLQRPGQGHEACFFDNTVPLEAIVSTDHMVDYFVKHVNLQEPIVVVTPNNECVKKARNFQLRLQGQYYKVIYLLLLSSSLMGNRFIK